MNSVFVVLRGIRQEIDVDTLCVFAALNDAMAYGDRQLQKGPVAWVEIKEMMFGNMIGINAWVKDKYSTEWKKEE